MTYTVLDGTNGLTFPDNTQLYSAYSLGTGRNLAIKSPTAHREAETAKAHRG